MQRRRDRDPEVKLTIGKTKTYAPVLREPALGDVEARHDFYSADYRRLILVRRTLHFLQNAVDPIANPKPIGCTLEMNVTGASPQCFEDHDVYHLDHRRLIGERPQIIQRVVLWS